MKKTLNEMKKKTKSEDRFLDMTKPVHMKLDMNFYYEILKEYTQGKGVFNLSLNTVMQNVASFLVQETHATLGHMQLGSIHLYWDNSNISLCPFAGKIMKLVSRVSSLATFKLMSELAYTSDEKLFDVASEYQTTFDAKAINLDNVEDLAEMVYYRESMGTRKALLYLASKYLTESYAETNKKQSGIIIQELADMGIDWFKLAFLFRRGSFYKRKLVDGKPVTYCAKIKNLNVEDDKVEIYFGESKTVD